MQSSFELMTKEQSLTTSKMADVLYTNKNLVLVNQTLKNDNIVQAANVTSLINEKHALSELYKQAKSQINETNKSEDGLNDKINNLTLINDDLQAKLDQQYALNLTLKNANDSFYDMNQNSSDQLERSLN